MSKVVHTKAVAAVAAQPEVVRIEGGRFRLERDYTFEAFKLIDGDKVLTILPEDDRRDLHAILSEILSPSVPPSPPVTPKPYVPRVNDVVRWDGWDKSEFLIQRIEPESPGYCHIHTVRVSGDKKGMAASFGAFGEATFAFVREATEEDRRVAAGLDAPVPPSDTPAPVVPSCPHGCGPMKRVCLALNVEAWECVAKLHAHTPAPVAAPTPAATTHSSCCSHASDCAVHNAPALPIGSCDCGKGGACQPAATTSEARPTWGPGVLAVEEAYRPAPAAKPTTPAADFDEADRKAAHLAYWQHPTVSGETRAYDSFTEGFLAGLSRARSGAGR